MVICHRWITTIEYNDYDDDDNEEKKIITEIDAIQCRFPPLKITIMTKCWSIWSYIFWRKYILTSNWIEFMLMPFSHSSTRLSWLSNWLTRFGNAAKGLVGWEGPAVGCGERMCNVTTYLIIVADAADTVSVNFSGRCKFFQI